MATDLTRIGQKARKEPKLVFTNFIHRVYDVDNLRACFDSLDTNKATGLGVRVARRIVRNDLSGSRMWESRLSGFESERSATVKWMKYCGTAAKAGGKQRKPTSSWIMGVSYLLTKSRLSRYPPGSSWGNVKSPVSTTSKTFDN